MLDRQIKFIWDFYGEDALETAEHHARHLVTFFSLNQLEYKKVDSQQLSEDHSIAFVVSQEKNVQIIKNSLRPHRATIEP